MKEIIKKTNAMKAKTGLTENCNVRLSQIKGYSRSCVNKSFLALIFGLLFFSGIKAQTIMSYQTAMQTLDPPAAVHLQSLITNIHPTAYLMQGVMTTYGEGTPVLAICDAVSVSMLYGNDPVISEIEMIKITANTLSDLPASIDLTQLVGLSDLKYLYLVFAYDACGGSTDSCLASIVEGIIQGTSSQITVIYRLSIPE
jgi:hypothetical protein